MNLNTLCDAVGARKLVKFRYRQELGERTFAPYIVYRTSAGHEHVSGYLMVHPQKPLIEPVWRDFETKEIQALSVTDKVFAVDLSFNPLNKRYANGIVCHVRQNLT